jgi:hypothetical protein
MSSRSWRARPRMHWHRMSFLWLPATLLMVLGVVVVVVYDIVFLLLCKYERHR